MGYNSYEDEFQEVEQGKNDNGLLVVVALTIVGVLLVAAYAYFAN